MSFVLEHAEAFGAVFATALAFALGGAAGRRKRRLRELAAAQDGTALVEFALAAPVLMALGLAAIQLALVAVSRRAVEGAAFASARSAAVWVPAPEGEGPNRLRLSGASPKRERIERAAALAILPVAPPGDRSLPGRDSAAAAAALETLARDTRIAPADLLTRRYAAARDRVRVDVAAGLPPVGGLLMAEPDDRLTVTVTYDCPLNVPFAARLFGKTDPRAPDRFQTALAASFTIWNEGIMESPLVIPEESN